MLISKKFEETHGIRIILLASTPDEKFQKYTFTYLGDIGWNGAMAEALILVNRMIKEQSWKPDKDKVIIEHVNFP